MLSHYVIVRITNQWLPVLGYTTKYNIENFNIHYGSDHRFIQNMLFDTKWLRLYFSLIIVRQIAGKAYDSLCFVINWAKNIDIAFVTKQSDRRPRGDLCPIHLVNW